MIYFTSDAHLGSLYHQDPKRAEKRLVDFLDWAEKDATEIYFLGDMIDFWYEYRYVVPSGFVRFFGKIAALTDKGIQVHFLVGNHDLWTGDYFQKELGAKVHHHALEVELLGKKFRLAHGDEECRKQNFSSNFLYQLFRNRMARLLASALHPRWLLGLAYYSSLKSRHSHKKKKEKYPHTTENPYFHLEDEFLVKWAKKEALKRTDIDFFLFGHRHLAFDLMLSAHQRILVLGDWYKGGSFIQWDGTNLLLEDFSEIQAQSE